MTIQQEALQSADRVIEVLQRIHDYSPYRNAIAEMFSDYLWHGNWDMTLDDLGDLPSIRFIQEDEYDQHMDDGDEDGNPRPEDPFTLIESHYIFLEN